MAPALRLKWLKVALACWALVLVLPVVTMARDGFDVLTGIVIVATMIAAGTTVCDLRRQGR